jgi:hypothetical protein
MLYSMRQTRRSLSTTPEVIHIDITAGERVCNIKAKYTVTRAVCMVLQNFHAGKTFQTMKSRQDWPSSQYVVSIQQYPINVWRNTA